MFIQCETFRTVSTNTSLVAFQGGGTTAMAQTSVSYTGTVAGSFSTYPLFSNSTWDAIVGTTVSTNITASGGTAIVTSTNAFGLSFSVTQRTEAGSGTVQSPATAIGPALLELGTSQTFSTGVGSTVWLYTEAGFTWKSTSAQTFSLITGFTNTFAVRTFTTTSPPGTSFTTSQTTLSTLINSLSSTTSFATSSTTNFTGTGASIVTDTVTTVNSFISSTTNFNVITTRWSVSTNGAPVRTTHTVSTVETVLTTSTSTCESTSVTTYLRTQDITAVLAYQPGTAFIGTGNGGVDLLAYYSNPSPGQVLVPWEYVTATNTTIWAFVPTATTGPVATLLTTAIAHPTSISFYTSSSYPALSFSTFTTTVSTAVAAPFSFTNAGVFSSNMLPFSTSVQTVTTFSTATTTFSAPVTTPFNTFLSGGPFGPQTTRTSLALATTDGSLNTTFTITTAVNGYTTAGVTLNIGGRTIVSTTIVSGPGLSFTITTAGGLWHYDWSCPTQLVSTTGAGSTTSGSTTISNSFSSSTLEVNGTEFETSASQATGGTYTGPYYFTQNLYANPYALAWNIVTVFGTVGTVPAGGGVAIWTAIPFMQAFVPWTATTNTFLGISAPPGVPAISLGAVETGQNLSSFTDQTSGQSAITTTSWGLWGLLGWPHITTGTTTSVSGTTTHTFTFTEVDSFTSSAFQTAASATVAASIAFPTNMDQAAASITVSSTGTTTTAGVPSTTTTFGSSTYSGLTYTGSFTQTFVESVALNSTHGPAAPGVGGYAKLGTGDCTAWCLNAGVSLFWNSTSTASVADMNFMGVVIGGTITASSSTTSNLGAGTFAVYSFPGQASMVTGPAFLATTLNSATATAIETATRFWPLPGPLLFPPVTQND